MLKLGVQLHLTPALSKACHPQCIKERFRINGVLYMLFQAIEQQLFPSINSCQGKEWFRLLSSTQAVRESLRQSGTLLPSNARYDPTSFHKRR